ncbi:MAG: AIPR family protein [bacterium]
MTSNDPIILDSLLKQKRAQYDSRLSTSNYFEVFVFEQILKEYDLSNEELLSGHVDGGGDGGLDGFFTLLGGELAEEDTEYDHYKRNVSIELFLVQVKESPSFQESALDRVISTVGDIFDLAKAVEILANHYNARLVSKVKTFREVLLGLAAKHPIVTITFYYACKGNVGQIHQNVLHKGRNLEGTLTDLFHGAKAETKFWGAREILEAARKEKTYTLALDCQEITTSREKSSYVVLAKLTDYFRFIADENGNLRRYIFESNVRDYQGSVSVNIDIRRTLENDDVLDFWWLNNGITIVASNATIVGKTITLDDVQVVNGLQTTQEIYGHFQNAEHEDTRSLLLKIVITKDNEARDRIIKATNFQTLIPVASLRATDRFQRDLETYFLEHGWFYERQKNHYTNLGKPADRIISIAYLAQAVMAIILQEPNNARARPTSLTKTDDGYAKVFNPQIHPKFYLFCAKTIKRIGSFFRSEACRFPETYKVNLKFHLAMWLVMRQLGKENYTPADLEALVDFMPDDPILNERHSELVGIAGKHISEILTAEAAEGQPKRRPITLSEIGDIVGLDKIAKSRPFVDYMQKTMRGVIAGKSSL